MAGRVMFVAGDPSGEIYGAGVVRALKEQDPELEIYGVGGDAMQAAGTELIAHCSQLAFMGFLEVIRNLGTIRRLERTLAALLFERRPDVVVLIDYPGFNLRFARRVKTAGVPVLYYISPQVWAWHRSRVRTMKGIVDRMKVVFPFEVEIYRKAGIDVEFVGHPLAERIGSSANREEFLRRHGFDPARRIVAMLPGSRPQEIERILPVMVDSAARLTKSHGIQAVLGVAPNLGMERIRAYVPHSSGIRLIENATYDLMCHADAAMVTSGTATLEAGWFGTPMVVVYRTSPVTYGIGRVVIDVPMIALCNIVAGRKVVPELIQAGLTPERLTRETARILDDPVYAAQLRQGLSVIREKLGAPGASRRVANAILSLKNAS